MLQLHHGYIDKVSELEACKTYTVIIMTKQLFIVTPHAGPGVTYISSLIHFSNSALFYDCLPLADEEAED